MSKVVDLFTRAPRPDADAQAQTHNEIAESFMESVHTGEAEGFAIVFARPDGTIGTLWSYPGNGMRLMGLAAYLSASLTATAYNYHEDNDF